MWLLPELSITVNMDPPPMPMLCGFMTEVHSSAAMAPSTAEPRLCRMSLKELTLITIHVKLLYILYFAGSRRVSKLRVYVLHTLVLCKAYFLV